MPHEEMAGNSQLMSADLTKKTVFHVAFCIASSNGWARGQSVQPCSSLPAQPQRRAAPAAAPARPVISHSANALPWRNEAQMARCNRRLGECAHVHVPFWTEASPRKLVHAKVWLSTTSAKTQDRLEAASAAPVQAVQSTATVVCMH